MSSIEELRPPEALYLLGKAGIEDMNEATLLAATLGSLVDDDYLRIENGKISRTGKLTKNLRQYEKDCLNAVGKENMEEIMFFAIDPEKIRNELIQNGFLEPKKKKFLSIIPIGTEYLPTDKFKPAIKELKQSKDKKKMKYAFPSQIAKDEILVCAREIIGIHRAYQAQGLWPSYDF
jgi:hypothetical protein